MSERLRQSIPVQGLNTAEPCHTVADGSMAELHNVRYKNGAFVNVCEPQVLHSITQNSGHTIVYKMECLGANEYIATTRYGNFLVVVAIVDGVVQEKSNIGTVEHGNGEMKLSHFGNVLYINWGEGVDLSERCYRYADGAFAEFDINAIAPVELKVNCEREVAPTDNQILGNLLMTVIKSGANETKEAYYNIPKSKLNDKGYVVGSFFLIAAYVMFDGTIIKPSEIRFISSQYDDGGVDWMVGGNFNHYDLARLRADYNIHYYSFVRGVKATVEINNAIAGSDLIKGVSILATRVQQQFTYDDVHEKFALSHQDSRGEYSYSSVIFNNDATDLDQPFYEVAYMDLSEKMSVELDYKKLEDTVFGSVYKPSFSTHKTLSNARFDYNNRLHSFAIKTQLFDGYGFDVRDLYGMDKKVAEGYLLLRFNLNIDGQARQGCRVGMIDIVRNATGGATYAVLPNLLIYPDSRVKSVDVIIADGNKEVRSIYSGVSVKVSRANNLTYAYLETDKRMNNTNRVHYRAVSTATGGLGHLSKYEKPPSVFRNDNKIHVSAQNNPFFIDPANIYTIGSNGCIIDSINTATEQITETKFGMYPLYVFTSTAITALEVGSGEVLYSRIVDITNETKIPNTGTAGAHNLVFFCSARGVMALEGRSVYCVSEHLRQCAGLGSGDFEEYCTHVRFSYNPIESELLLCNPAYSYAYVYSLQGKFWSRRDWRASHIGALNEMQSAQGIVSAWREDPSRPLLECVFVSRAIKLGAFEFKRLETLVARLHIGNLSNYELMVYGSNDLLSWTLLAKVTDHPTLRRTGASCKYLRIELRCFVRDYLSVQHFDVEYYFRFVRRLK